MVLSIYAITLGLAFAIGPMLLTKVETQGFLPFATSCVLIVLAAIPILAA
ncbi:hypothetical protein [Bartonella rattaustraliani]|nr:hypothetical protein [Bartonella rattaustraliani]